jgi:hypothetical protein
MGPISFIAQAATTDLITDPIYPQRISDTEGLIQIEMVGAGSDTTGDVTLQGRVSNDAPWDDIETWDETDMTGDTMIDTVIQYPAMRIVLANVAGSDPVINVWLEY